VSTKQIESNQAAAIELFDGEATALTEAELLAIHGGTSPSGGGSDSSSYGPAEFRQDLSTVGSATGLGNAAVPGGLGAAAGFGFGLGVVVEQRLGIIDRVGDFVGDVVDTVNAAELANRGNIA
jgi:hypothetical protein